MNIEEQWRCSHRFFVGRQRGTRSLAIFLRRQRRGRSSAGSPRVTSCRQRGPSRAGARLGCVWRSALQRGAWPRAGRGLWCGRASAVFRRRLLRQRLRASSYGGCGERAEIRRSDPANATRPASYSGGLTPLNLRRTTCAFRVLSSTGS